MTAGPLPQDPDATSVISWGPPPQDAQPDAQETARIAAHRAPEPTVDTAGEVLPALIGEAVTCPECGTVAHVTLNRREALDFCRTCDYPLFWVPTTILRGAADQQDESLRRLPGTAGRVSVASLACPVCAEPNGLTALRCARCGADMHPVEAPPPPPPAPRVVLPLPEPEPAPEKRGVPWWVWLLLALGAAALVVVVVLLATGVLH